MRISLNTNITPDRLDNVNGYGYATERMLASLERLDYEVTVNDPTADVGIVFNQPIHAKWYGDQYRIMYHPWESTQLLPGWAAMMNEADEVWTPSPLIANWYTTHAGITKPVHVYEHGVDDIWTPVERKVDGPFTFLHIGAESLRKGARETMRCFRSAFGHDADVRLRMKMISSGWNITSMNGIDVLNNRMSIQELISLYHDSHVFVYPSWGEGFGLTPLQAMATGMPTITVPSWAPYAHHLDPNLSISSEMAGTPWPTLHPGQMLKPNEDDLIDAYRYARDNYDEVSSFAHRQIEGIKSYYDWDNLTAECFSSLEKRLENSPKILAH